MKRRALILTALGALTAGMTLWSGCTTIRELPRETRAKEEPKGAAYTLCRALLTAFLRNDGKAFVALLPAESRKNFPVEAFDKTRKSVVDSVGTPISFQYVTSLELTTFTPHIWKIRFKRTDRANKREFTSELLFRIIIGELDNRPVITGFQFL